MHKIFIVKLLCNKASEVLILLILLMYKASDLLGK